MRLIDIDAVIGQIKNCPSYKDYEWSMYADEFVEILDSAPTIEPKQADDLISRADAIEAVERAVTKEVARWSIKELPSAQPKQGEWIPCSERLPTEDKNAGYIITDSYGYVYQASLKKDMNGRPCFRTYEIGWDIEAVAWMEMPEPYKGGAKMEVEE